MSSRQSSPHVSVKRPTRPTNGTANCQSENLGFHFPSLARSKKEQKKSSGEVGSAKTTALLEIYIQAFPDWEWMG